jgi:hypothetical protein
VSGTPGTYVPRAWLPDDAVPFVYHRTSTVGWTLKRSTTADPKIGDANVVSPPPTDPGWSRSGYTIGQCLPFDAWTQLGIVGAQSKSYRNEQPTGHSATQTLWFFRDEAAARQAMQTISALHASCRLRMGTTDLTTGEPVAARIDQTATFDGDAAWLESYRRPNGSPADITDINPLNHAYFVQRGNVIANVGIMGLSDVDNVGDDQAVLRQIAAHLCVYGGNC